MALAETGEGPEGGNLTAKRARAGAFRAAARHEGAHVGRGKRRNIGESRRCAKVSRQKAEELLQIALVGFKRVRREPTLVGKMRVPVIRGPTEVRGHDNEELVGLGHSSDVGVAGFIFRDRPRRP